MDHLEFTTAERVPLLADTSLLQEKGVSVFDSFHDGSQGFKVTEGGRHESMPDRRNYSEEFSGFVQRWLFFSLLLEIFGDQEGFSIETYYYRDITVRQRISGYIRTDKLLEDIKVWQAYECSNINGRTARLIHKQHVLNRARQVVFDYCSVTSKYLFDTGPQGKKEPRWSNVDDKIVLSIMALGQTLSRAMVRIQRSSGFGLKEWQSHDESSEGWGYSSKVVDELTKKKNWCPHAIYKLFVLFRGNTLGLWYISKLVEYSEPNSPPHGNCAKASKCQCPFPKEKRLAHSPSCRGSDRAACNRIGPEERGLLETIRNGKIPLLRYFPREVDVAKRLRITEMEPSFDTEYAIFSHVWTDHVGDPGPKVGQFSVYAMNECVLRWFSKIFKEITGNPEPQPFWIDTLCIPGGGDAESFEMRKKAVQDMHNVYTHANYTVVIDSGLTTIARDDYIKMAVQIIVSKWMTRLWTLQEAVLSKNLYFQLQNNFCALQNLEQEFEREDRLKPSCVPSTVRAYYHNMLGDERALIHQHESPEWKPSASFVGRVWKAARWRTTAWLQHETLALAMLLKLSTSDFADASNTTEDNRWNRRELDQRMKKLLDLLSRTNPCPIPPGIIFLPGERLSFNGYRWAPRTWMQPTQIDPPDPIMVPGPSPRLNPPNGLEVQFPGFVLHDLSGDQSFREQCRRILFSSAISLSEWYSVTKADIEESDKLFTKESLQIRPGQDRQFAIIMPQYPLVHPKEIALLVYVKEKRGGFLYVKIVNRVWVSREVNQEELNDKRANFRKKNFGVFSCGDRLLHDQWWCVDAPWPGTQKSTDLPVQEKVRADTNPRPLRKDQKSQTWWDKTGNAAIAAVGKLRSGS